MDKIIDMNSLFSYREAVKRLEKNHISYKKSKLLNNPQLCNEIIKMMDYFDEKKEKR